MNSDATDPNPSKQMKPPSASQQRWVGGGPSSLILCNVRGGAGTRAANPRQRQLGGLAGKIVEFREQTQVDRESFDEAARERTRKLKRTPPTDVIDALSQQLEKAERRAQKPSHEPPSISPAPVVAPTRIKKGDND